MHVTDSFANLGTHLSLFPWNLQREREQHKNSKTTFERENFILSDRKLFCIIPTLLVDLCWNLLFQFFKVSLFSHMDTVHWTVDFLDFQDFNYFSLFLQPKFIGFTRLLVHLDIWTFVQTLNTISRFTHKFRQLRQEAPKKKSRFFSNLIYKSEGIK